MPRALVVEDEPQLAALVKDYLAIAGIEAETEGDGAKGLGKALAGGWDVVLLDAMLPSMDGFAVLERLREACEVPVIMLTALREDADKIRGFGLGADDYVTKPFSPAELVARVKARIERAARLAAALEGAGPARRIIRDGNLELDSESARVTRDGVDAGLTAKEYELALLFMRNPDRLFPKEEIYARVWGDDRYGDISTVTVHVRRLREKIERDPANPERIETVWGMGYRWKPA